MSAEPPSYEQATGSSSASQPSAAQPSTSQHLPVPGAGAGPSSIPLSQRRSMEDENRPLPDGWVRQFDPKSEHQYFVDTKANPPRSIWHHPYDDEVYLNGLTSEERERIEEMERKPPTKAQMIAAESDTENEHYEPPPLPPRPTKADQSQGRTKFGRKLKDKLTGTTHEQREAERRRQAQLEKEMFQRHQMIRQGMQRAFETGVPQFIGKDNEGHDVYIEPPRGGPYYQGGQSYGYNPYAQGPYQQPNSRFIPYPAPQYPYSRPYGNRGGSGLGLPLLGGLLGGALLGELLLF